MLKDLGGGMDKDLQRARVWQAEAAAQHVRLSTQGAETAHVTERHCLKQA